MLINKGPSSTFTLRHVAKYFQTFHIDFLDCFELFEFNGTQQKVLSMKLQISSLFETQMTSYRMMKRMRLGSSVYLLLRAFIVNIRNEKKLDNASNGVASSSIQWWDSGGSHGFERTRSWNAGIIGEPVLVFCYRHSTFVIKMREPVNSKYNSKENLFLKFWIPSLVLYRYTRCYCA